MRTTITIDDDIAKQLEQEMRHSRKPFKQVINKTLRLGLAAGKQSACKPFVVKPWNLEPPHGLSFDNVHSLLDALDGPERR